MSFEEIDPSHLGAVTEESLLGSGTFGAVYEGTFGPGAAVPAVSTQREGRDWSLLTGAPTLKFKHSFKKCHYIAVAPQFHLTSPSFVVYVTDRSANTVHMFDGTTGQPIRSSAPSSGIALWAPWKWLISGLSAAASSVGSKGSGPGQFICPSGIAVSSSSSSSSGAPSSDVFVCDSNNERVQVFSTMGVYKRSFGSVHMFPEGLSIDHVRHEVHVCDNGRHCIRVFAESDGRHLFSYGSYGYGRGQLVYPTGVAVDSERGLVAVVDNWNPRVSVFKSSGEFVRCLGHGGEDIRDPKCQFGKQSDKYIALDPQSGHIVVSDSGTKRVQVMTWEGEWVGGFGPGLPMRGPGLKSVNGVAVGPQGQLFLCCTDSDDKCRVMYF